MIEIGFPDSGGSVYQFKKAIKSEKQNYFRNTDPRKIVVKDVDGNRLQNMDSMGDLIDSGHGTIERPFLVDSLAAGTFASSNVQFLSNTVS